MALIPLEDNFNDVINKAQRGLGLSDTVLAQKSGLAPAQLAALKEGRFDERAVRAVAPALRLHAAALAALGRKEWRPETPLFPRGFAMFNTAYEDMRVNSYLVWDSRSRQAAAFDTGATAEGMLETIAAEKLSLRYILLTHTHEDHIADLARLQAASGAEVYASEREPVAGGKTFKEGFFFHLGELAIKTLSTWGHSPGQTTYLVTGLAHPLAVVGDSLFASSMGGSATHYAEQHRHDVEKILSLTPDTVLACGHGPLTTVGEERRHNPFFAR